MFYVALGLPFEPNAFYLTRNAEGRIGATEDINAAAQFDRAEAIRLRDEFRADRNQAELLDAVTLNIVEV
jgi:hypothetical protein